MGNNRSNHLLSDQFLTKFFMTQRLTYDKKMSYVLLRYLKEEMKKKSSKFERRLDATLLKVLQVFSLRES